MAENRSPICQLYAVFAALFLPYKQNIASVKSEFSKAKESPFKEILDLFRTITLVRSVYQIAALNVD